jgi:hypothetical protein
MFDRGDCDYRKDPLMTPMEEFDIACQVHEGSQCERLDMLAKCYAELKAKNNIIKDLKIWNIILERQLKRYRDGDVYRSHTPTGEGKIPAE